MDEIDPTVVSALETFLRIPCPTEEETQQKQQQQPQQQQQQQKESPYKEISTAPSFSSAQSSLFSQISHEATINDEFSCPREVILHNCEGGNNLEEFVALLMETNTSLAIRYDKQRTLPTQIARGLQKGAEHGHDSFCKLRSLTLKGMTLTPLTASYLQIALPLLPNLEQLTLKGNFTLAELDRQKSSIVGIDPSKIFRVVGALYQTLKNLPQLRHLDLQQCHLSDEVLADLLGALYPDSIVSLNLRGNKANQESQHVLYQLMSHEQCQLKHLDLSWQRLPNARRNYSILDFGILASVLAERNDSLQTLNLSENKLLDEDVACLAVGLTRHPSLSRVRLQDCRITDRGMLALAHELPKWPEQLHHLHLDGNQSIRTATAALVRKEMFRSVLRNVFLKELALPHQLQSHSTEWALELNKAGRRVLLENVPSERDCPDPAIECTLTSAPSFDSQTGTNHICDALWPTILERADRVARMESNREESSTTKAASAVYLLLREKGFHAVISSGNQPPCE